MSRKRRKFSPIEKAKIAIEAIKGIHTLNQIGQQYSVHPTLVNKWRKDLIERSPDLFADKRSTTSDNSQQLIDELYKQIGQLIGERDWLKKKSEFFN
jgi:transposase